MEEEYDPSEVYIKNFNNGYLMCQHEPELLDKLLSNDKEQSETMKAMNAGKKQYELELMRKELEQGKNRNKQNERER